MSESNLIWPLDRYSYRAYGCVIGVLAFHITTDKIEAVLYYFMPEVGQWSTHTLFTQHTAQ